MRLLIAGALGAALFIAGCGQAAAPTPSPTVALAGQALPPSPTSIAFASGDEAVLAVNKLSEAGKFEEAGALATQALKAYPKNYQLLTNRGSSYVQLEKWQQASDDFTAALAVAPPEVRWTLLSQRARCAYQMKKPKDAEKDYAAAVKVMGPAPDPAFAEQLWRLRGSNLVAEKRYKDSLPCFTEAMKYAPDDTRALALRAFCYGTLGDEKHLDADLASLRKRDPQAALQVEETLDSQPKMGTADK